MSRLGGVGTGLAVVGLVAGAGWVVDRSMTGVVVGAIVGAVAAVLVLALRVRPLVAVPVVAGTAAGALAGKAVIRVLCLPSGCAGFETLGAVLFGIGAFVGLAVVVALASRSLDEYREQVGAGRRTPGPGPADPTGPDDDASS